MSRRAKPAAGLREISGGEPRRPAARGKFQANAVVLLVVVFLWQPFQFLEEHQPAMGRNLEALPADLARHVVVHAYQMVLALLEYHAVSRIRPGRNLRLAGSTQPTDGVVARATAARALKLCRALLRLLGKELTFIHDGSVHEVGDESESRSPRADRLDARNG